VTLHVASAWHMPGQVLQDRYAEAPRSDQSQRFLQGIWKVKKVAPPGEGWKVLDAPCLAQKTGEQLLQMCKQMIFHGCGIMPCKEWYGATSTQWRTSLCPPSGRPWCVG